jgi:hypothetical protein
LAQPASTVVATSERSGRSPLTWSTVRSLTQPGWLSDRTRSWFDPATGSSLRYSKRERSPLTDRDEQVEILPETQRWVENGGSAELATTEPLDELSFLYYVRTLPLEDGDVYRVARHFDVRRNPVTIEVLGR